MPLASATSSGVSQHGARFALRDTPDKGVRLFATADVLPGEVVMTDALLFKVSNGANKKDTNARLMRAFLKAPVTVQRQILDSRLLTHSDLKRVRTEAALAVSMTTSAPRRRHFTPDELRRASEFILVSAQPLANNHVVHELWPRLAHSCHANTFMTVLLTDGTLQCVANRRIAEGDMLTCDHLNEYASCSTLARQMVLRNKFGIEGCDCSRCKDVDLASAIPCPVCSCGRRDAVTGCLDDLAVTTESANLGYACWHPGTPAKWQCDKCHAVYKDLDSFGWDISRAELEAQALVFGSNAVHTATGVYLGCLKMFGRRHWSSRSSRLRHIENILESLEKQKIDSKNHRYLLLVTTANCFEVVQWHNICGAAGPVYMYGCVGRVAEILLRASMFCIMAYLLSEAFGSRKDTTCLISPYATSRMQYLFALSHKFKESHDDMYKFMSIEGLLAVAKQSDRLLLEYDRATTNTMAPFQLTRIVDEGIAENLQQSKPIGKIRQCASCSRTYSEAGGGAVKMLRCAGCKLAIYCGRNCQKKHWPEHRLKCGTLMNEGDGRMFHGTLQHS